MPLTSAAGFLWGGVWTSTHRGMGHAVGALWDAGSVSARVQVAAWTGHAGGVLVVEVDGVRQTGPVVIRGDHRRAPGEIAAARHDRCVIPIRPETICPGGRPECSPFRCGGREGSGDPTTLSVGPGCVPRCRD